MERSVAGCKWAGLAPPRPIYGAKRRRRTPGGFKMAAIQPVLYADHDVAVATIRQSAEPVLQKVFIYTSGIRGACVRIKKRTEGGPNFM